MKRIFKVVLLLLVSFLLVISAYFYLQHRVSIWHYSIDRNFNVEDVQINITEMYVKNYERNKNYNVLNRNNIFYTLANKLPYKAVYVLTRIDYFYSDPYSVSKEYGTIGLKGRVISDKLTIADMQDFFAKNIEIGIIDDTDRYYSRGLTTKYENNNYFIEFMTEGDKFPLDKLNKKLKMYIKNKQTKDIQQYDVKSKFIKSNYGFFKRVPNDFN